MYMLRTSRIKQLEMYSFERKRFKVWKLGYLEKFFKTYAFATKNLNTQGLALPQDFLKLYETLLNPK